MKTNKNLLVGLSMLMVASFPLALRMSSSAVVAENENVINPIAFYEFNDSTNLGKDSIGTNHLVTYGEGLTISDGALNFASGSMHHASYVHDPYSSQDFSDVLTGDYSFTFDVKKAANPGEWNPVFATGNGYDQGLTIFLANGNIDVKSCNSTDNVFGVSAVNGNQYNNIAITYTASNTKLTVYVDGVSVGTKTVDAHANANDFAFSVGGRWNQWSESIVDGTTASFGSIKNLRIWNEALNEANVGQVIGGEQVIRDAVNTEPTTPLAFYRFDEKMLGRDAIGTNDLVTVGEGLTVTDGALNFASGSMLHAQYVHEPYSALDFTDALTGDYTIAFEVKKAVDPGEWNPVLATGNGYDQGLTIFLANGNIDVKTCNSTDNVFGASAIDGTSFNKVVVSYVADTTTLSVSIDGTIAGTKTVDGHANANDFAFSIGGRWNQWSETIIESTSSFGSIKNVMLFNKALSAAEVEVSKTAAIASADTLKTTRLAAAKTAAIAELDAIVLSNYREAQKTVVSTAITTAKTAINAATDLLDVESAMSTARTAIGAVKTDAQLTAEEAAAALAAAKTAAKAELESYKNSSDYRNAQQAVLASAITTGKSAIDAATDLAGVASALAAAKATIDAIKTNAQLTAEELAAAKTAAITELRGYLATKGVELSSSKQGRYETLVAEAETSINAATAIDQINPIVEAAKLSIDSLIAEREGCIGSISGLSLIACALGLSGAITLKLKRKEN